MGANLTSAEKKQWEQEARLVVDLLQNHHYSGRAFRDLDSRAMLDRFLDELDGAREYLTQDDRNLVHRRFDRTLKSVYLFRGDLQPAFEIFDLFAQRVRERLDWVERRLAREFDFSGDDTYTPAPPDQASLTAAQLDQHWESSLRARVLREMLAGRDPVAARAEVLRQYQRTRRHVDSFDVLAVREHFFDALIRSYDPHSGYSSADSAREFTLGMQNAVGGIGLDLKKENGRCEITRIQPGGPADLTSPLRPGDVIVALAEGDAPWTEAAPLRLRELVARVRGAPGTSLRLAYQRADDPTRQEITLQRTRVILTAERAHGAVSLVPDTAGHVRRIGWITLPAFYGDTGENTASSAAADVRELIEQMQGAGLDGLTLDLRHNPGGAMHEAVALGSLFLPSGNVVLSRLPGGQITEFPVTTATAPLYTGPLVVLTSAASASASEVFAGAMKFHRRALIVGASATFGKGTMQNYIELAKITNPPPAGSQHWGTLRLTAQHFFCPDGRAVQLNGVSADLILPAPFAQGFKRERELAQALPAQDISPPQPATPAPLTVFVTPALQQAAATALAGNIATLPEWTLWQQEQAAWAKHFADDALSLNETKRREEWRQQLTQWADHRRTRRALAQQAAFPTETFEIASVAAAYARHQERLRHMIAADGAASSVRLHDDALLIPVPPDRLRRVWLTDFDVREFLGDVAELAQVYQAATGRPINANALEQVLLDFSLLEQPTQAALLTCFARHDAGAGDDPDRLHQGVEACLARMVALNGEWSRSRPALDVPLREALRLASLWAGQIPPVVP